LTAIYLKILPNTGGNLATLGAGNGLLPEMMDN